MNNPIDKNSIRSKLTKLQEAVQVLEDLKRVPEEKFLVDKQKSGATQHYLVIAIEVIIDIGQHILSEIFQTRGQSYEEIILKLGEMEVVPDDFAKDNADMAKFRNLLIHEYIKVNMKTVYENLQKAPDVFRKFAKYYIEFLEKI